MKNKLNITKQEANFFKERSLKLTKKALSLFLVGTSSITMLTSCVNTNKNYNNYKNSDDSSYGYYNNENTNDNKYYDDYYYNNNTTTQGDVSNYITSGTTTTTTTKINNSGANNNSDSHNLVLDDLEIKIINSEVTLDSSLNTFIQQVNSVNVNYPYSEFYNISGALNEYNKLNKSMSTGENAFGDGKITAEKLYSVVLKNNANYNFNSKFIMDNSKILEICKIVVDVVNSNIDQLNSNEKIILLEKLSNLKIKKFYEFGYGLYDPANAILGVAVDNISSSSELKKIVEHETFHLIQAGTPKEMENSNIVMRFGPVVEFKNLDVNSLYWNWYFEGSAEDFALSLNEGMESQNYKTYVRTMDAIKLAHILDSDVKLDDFSKLSLHYDLDKVFEYFGCKNSKDEEEVIKLMFSFDIILGSNRNNSVYNFYKLCEKNYSGFDRLDFQTELKSSVASTLTKKFYVNLANEVKNKKLTVGEIFSYISIFETEMSRLCAYSTAKEEHSEFFDIYINIQTNFFNYISKELNVNTTDVQEAYNAFNKNCELSVNELTLSSSEKKEFYQHMMDSRKNNKTKSINYIYVTNYSKQKGR